MPFFKKIDWQIPNYFVHIESSTRLEKNYHRIDRTEVHLCNLQHCKCLHTLQVVCQIDIILNDALQHFQKENLFQSYILCRNYTKTSILHHFKPIFYPLCIKISTSNSQWRLCMQQSRSKIHLVVVFAAHFSTSNV